MIRPFRPVYDPRPVFFWLGVGCFVVALVALLAWCGDMREQDCKAHGGDHLRSVGRYAEPLCVSKDGRIVE